MIGRVYKREQPAENDAEAKGFDAFELRLGDVMRGERATLGKSLLDVQRELKIKAAYIAAIENCDPTAFDTPGFIAGYVRSYARYLGMDPDEAFGTFCNESGFRPAHGMSPSASAARTPRPEQRVPDEGPGRDIFASSATPFIPAGDSLFAGLEPRALGSVAVLIALIGGLGWGAWSVLQEVQKVRFAPVEQAPTVVAELDPLAGATRPEAVVAEVPDTVLPSPEALDRLYRPQALDVPVLVARDGPIASLSPRSVGALLPQVDNGARLPGAVPAEGERFAAADEAAGPVEAEVEIPTGSGAVPPQQVAALGAGLMPPGIGPVPQVTSPVPEMQIVAVRPAWVRVRSAEGTTLFEKIMDAGETWQIPVTEEPATLRVGESGALYFAVNGQHYGPAGPRGQITSDLALSADTLTSAYQVADLTADTDLAEFVRYAEAQIAAPAVPDAEGAASE
ncbi:helix-turn-helix domain-containing protein [Wenxinia marina]|uniref:Cytoskeleton protein RodZ-like C-terminal domain-containing protein n=1 Tax=Wenxinia marina DSM 24838 TaxID=1123501 RepID=A0A0D0PAG0_9RHOB|nr:helix-turn-helix domain-containing protein [Wenxinia marina]KIQ68486.1 protein of unknown function/Helix-turn-helix domain protein [Wenxinia marina DSM 24838]GGL66130.1 4-hydroxy-3-methylbut-2-en-1-yl diphosphate synthase [Wenxinia marina]